MNKINVSDTVQFEDYSDEIAEKFKQVAIAALYEAAGELEAQVKRNTPVDSGQLKASWQYVVDENKMEATIGSPLEHAIWNEFGTGEYALEGNGRKGGWWIKVGSGANEMSQAVAKKYKWKRIRRDKNGNITFVFTDGKKPKRTLHNAFETKKAKIQAIIKRKLGELK